MTNKTQEIETELEHKIAQLANAEKITKTVLGELSIELLNHYQLGGSVSLINKLLGEMDGRFILTPLNWKLAVQYFRFFIPHTSNWELVKDYIEKGEGPRIPLSFGGISANRRKKLGSKLTALVDDA